MSLETAFEVGRLYAPIREMADIMATSQDRIFLELPAIIGWWPSGPVDGGNAAMENMASAQAMTQVGVCPVGFDGHPYRILGGGTNYFNNVSIGGFTGIETWVESGIRGFTVGGWFWFSSLPTTSAGMITKDLGAPQRGYALVQLGAGETRFSMSGTGAAIISATSVATATLGQWHFCVGRYIPSTEVALFMNGVKSVNTTAIPNSAFISSQDFEIGRFIADNSRILDGRARDMFVCAAALSDELINEIRQTST